MWPVRSSDHRFQRSVLQHSLLPAGQEWIAGGQEWLFSAGAVAVRLRVGVPDEDGEQQHETIGHDSWAMAGFTR